MSFVGIDTNFTLPSRFYTSTEIFEEELERIFYSRWIYVAYEADIPKPGDYVALQIGRRSFFLQRTERGDVRDDAGSVGGAASGGRRCRAGARVGRWALLSG